MNRNVQPLGWVVKRPQKCQIPQKIFRISPFLVVHFPKILSQRLSHCDGYVSRSSLGGLLQIQQPGLAT